MMPIRAAILVVLLSSSVFAAGDEPVSIAVMEFSSKGGVSQDQMDALSDLLAGRIEALGDFQVIGRADIQAMLSLEEQKQRLSACDDQACLAELGGALGVRWVVVGNVSKFDQTYLLNLKLIDVARVQVAGRVSRSLTGGQSELVAVLPAATRALFEQAAGRLGIELKETAGGVRIEAGQPPPGSSVQESLHWFTSSVDRQGRWHAGINTGPAGLAPGTLRYGDDLRTEYRVGLQPIEGARTLGQRHAVEAGYGLFSWLSASVWGAYFRAQGEGTYGLERLDATLEAQSIARVRQAFELGARFRFSWPVDFWIEPSAHLALGVHWMKDKTPESEVPDACRGVLEGQCLLSLEGFGFMLDAGLGVDFYLYPRWRLGLDVTWLLRNNRDLMADDLKLDASLWAMGLAVGLHTAWLF